MCCDVYVYATDVVVQFEFESASLMFAVYRGYNEAVIVHPSPFNIYLR